LSYTLICTGPFFDWGLAAGFLVDGKARSVPLYDGGDRAFSTTTLPAIGKAVAGVLKNPKETENRAVYVQEAAVTMKQLLAMAEKATGTPWQSKVASTEDELSQGWAELKKDEPNPHIFVMSFLRAAICGDGYGSYFETTDNELLGIKELSEPEIQAVVQAALGGGVN
jgi:hypothetical protein